MPDSIPEGPGATGYRPSIGETCLRDEGTQGGFNSSRSCRSYGPMSACSCPSSRSALSNMVAPSHVATKFIKVKYNLKFILLVALPIIQELRHVGLLATCWEVQITDSLSRCRQPPGFPVSSPISQRLLTEIPAFSPSSCKNYQTGRA